MASNYTTNYQLNQWEAGDQVLRTEFNQDNQKIDAAIKGVDQKVTNLSSSTSSQRSQLTSAVAKLGNCGISVGTYTGTGSNPTALNFSRKPLFIYLANATEGIHMAFLSNMAEAYCYTGGTYYPSQISWQGNTLQLTSDGGSTTAPYRLNAVGKTYLYMALLAEDD